MHRLLALLSTCLLLGCAGPGVRSDYKLDLAGKNGLVVGSLTYASFMGKFSVEWRPLGGGPPLGANVGYANWPPLGPLHDDELKEKGGTFAIEVPAGDYVLTGWALRQGVTTYSPKTRFEIPFKVAAGKVTYLGNFHYHQEDFVSLEDKSIRDLPVLRQRFEAVKTSPLAFALVEGVKLESLGGGVNKAFDGPLFIPVPVRAR